MRLLVLVASLLTIFEWTSFFSASILSAIVLSKSIGILYAFLIFFSGFIGRPLGAIILGIIGDKFGRKVSLIFTAFLLFLGNLGIFSNVTIYILISILLLGISLGGEWSSASVIVAETSKFKAFWISFIQIGVPIGLLLSSILALDRIVYLILSFIILFLFFLSFKVEESPLFKYRDKTTFSIDLRKMIIGILVKLGESSTFYFFVSFSLSYLYILGFGSSTVFLFITAIEEAFLILVFGHLSDIRGRKSISYLGFVFMTLSILFFVLFSTMKSYLGVLSSFLLFGFGDSAVYAAQGAILSELFKTENRTLSVGVSYQLSALLAGGVTPVLLSINHSIEWLILVPCIYIFISMFGLNFISR
ncbi:MFS transporter [Acidianus sulfidivorans JP7]|uniref:Major facilitator superfamily (MFS) profile domain-containing protein n=1 Tax=Acidianus sulfidivorans JP7 TaxID=619593 RepID=A0A2U9IN40_9CREN|nr:MFS transporter [Acidianus sulfidivorans]AWR97489.1 MFS transporter [Acidianus sulfidivorans JP7]